MVKFMRCSIERGSFRAPVSKNSLPKHAGLLVAALMLSGCSADVSRFDLSTPSLSDKNQTASIPTPPEPVRPQSSVAQGGPLQGHAGAGVYDAAAAPVEQEQGVQMSALPDATAPQYQNPANGPVTELPPSPPGWNSTPRVVADNKPGGSLSGTHTSSQDTASRMPPLVGVAPGLASGSEHGSTIEVQRGDTLYRLSRRYGTSVSGLMQANNLSSPNLKPGQKLVIPAAGSIAPASTPRAAVTVAAATPVLTPPSAAVMDKYNGTYTVKQGDSLYAIALAHKVPFTELQQVNAIADVRKVRPGAVLKVPAVLGEQVAAAAPAADYSAPSSSPAIASSTQPTILNSERKVAEIDTNKATDAVESAPVTTSGSPKLRWPVTGKIIQAFGQRGDGTHNDGINLSVPLGAEVHVAEGGVVAYAGSELKGYGNLILVRHDNGWVTAYAHNDEVMVKRGDKVKRGQIIAKAGKSGTVDQPQVHFELRHGAKPVDPTPYMEKM